MTRRRLLAWLVGCVALVAGLVFLRRADRVPPEDRPRASSDPTLDARARALIDALPMLKVEAAVVIAFLADLERHDRKLSLRKDKARHADIQQFLLSTDFFLNGEDESRPLAYVRLYDPHLAPCYNPLFVTDSG